jgi:hypothetical protein
MLVDCLRVLSWPVQSPDLHHKRRQLNGAGLHYAPHGQVCIIQSSRYQHLSMVLRCAEADGTSRRTGSRPRGADYERIDVMTRQMIMAN